MSTNGVNNNKINGNFGRIPPRPVNQYNLNPQYFRQQFDELSAQLNSVRGKGNNNTDSNTPTNEKPRSREETSLEIRLAEIRRILDLTRLVNGSENTDPV